MGQKLWAIWKVRKNMNADMKWLDNPEVFKVNQLEPHSDHCYYLDYSDIKKEKNHCRNNSFTYLKDKELFKVSIHIYTKDIDRLCSNFQSFINKFLHRLL